MLFIRGSQTGWRVGGQAVDDAMICPLPCSFNAFLIYLFYNHTCMLCSNRMRCCAVKFLAFSGSLQGKCIAFSTFMGLIISMEGIINEKE